MQSLINKEDIIAIKLHCDRCDEVIIGKYYEIQIKTTNFIDFTGLFEYKTICSDCMRKMYAKDEKTSDKI